MLLLIPDGRILHHFVFTGRIYDNRISVAALLEVLNLVQVVTPAYSNIAMMYHSPGCL
ncbi:hypothetical protein [Ornithinibacillus bavariensis]|uniref:Uncharacterized protein n=1 Tax=Ornithinibacillus bavariensis TaxID=545502 RepID=A0A919X930_9BACI|nr:hypothetical protein [Ornithinibacillus bavariensis]GIO28281.1 hypothetical protein J43TS3_28920 [Ornithinibacillus bavariensis]